jgi:hypothetical protein
MMTKEDCEDFRRRLKVIADELGTRRQDRDMPAEAIANVTLAYRHLEDASMRVGKAIQAIDGGVSVYDKDQVPA